MTLLVRDERDVIAATIEYHLAQGVQHLIVTDNGSVDGTLNVLAEYVAAGVVTLLHEPARDYEQGRWVTRMARLAYTEGAADWVINGDADEFWRPQHDGRTLHDVLSDFDPTIGSVTVDRFNLVGAGPDNTPWPRRLIYRDLETQTERGTPLGPKVCHRGAADVTVAQGNHGVTSEALGAVMTDAAIEILHVPSRSYAQYETKIRNGGQSYESNPRFGPGVGWHWREDYQCLQAGELRAKYEARLPDVSDARYRYDPTLLIELTALLPGAVRPHLLRQVLDGAAAGQGPGRWFLALRRS